MVETDTKSRVYRFYHLNPDCTVAGPVTVRVIKGPSNGTLEIDSGPGYSGYPQDNARAKCNTVQTEVTNVWYRSNSNFTGQDESEVEAFFTTGSSIRTKLVITVK